MCRIDIIEYSYMLCIDIVGYIDIRSDLEMGIRMKNESPLLQIGQRVERISLFLKVCERLTLIYYVSVEWRRDGCIFQND